MFEKEYREIVKELIKSNNPFEILSNYDNLKWLIEKEKYYKKRNKHVYR